MTEPPRVIFGDDGSPFANLAWEWINRQRWGGWDLQVLRVSRSGRPEPDEQARQPDPGAGMGEVETVHLPGRAADVLASRETALLVVGPKGTGRRKALPFGSTLVHLLGHARSPLLVAKSPTAVRSVLVCADGSPHGERAVDALFGMPWLDQIRTVWVLGVYTVGMYDDTDTITQAAEAVAGRLAPFAPELITVEGDPTASILAELSARGPDLAVLGNYARTGLARLYPGSTAASVAEAAECSVLLAR